MVSCTVMVRSFLRLQRVDSGFAPDHLLTFGLEPPEKSYPPEAADAFWHRLVERLRALPGVRRAGLLLQLPPSSSKQTTAILFPGRSPSASDESDWLLDFTQLADSDAYEALGARVVRGRGFAPGDTRGAPNVALVNERFAAKFFHGRDPIGQLVQLPYGNEPVFTVIGVIGDIKNDGLDHSAGTELTLPLWQYVYVWNRPHAIGPLYAVLRTDGDPAAALPAVQRAVGELDPTLPLFKLRTMDEVVWEAVARPRFLMFLLSAFAGIALVLAAVGIYGVMAHTVAQRTHEIGLRVALGARPAQVRAMVLRQATALVALGVASGLAAVVLLSIGLGATLSTLFNGDDLIQPGLLVAVVVAVVVAALLATWIPLRRATRVQPTVALRAE